MDDRDDFLRAIYANPADDGLRLIFADWLDEHEEPERAEFIRVQIELDKTSQYAVRKGDALARDPKTGIFVPMSPNCSYSEAGWATENVPNARYTELKEREADLLMGFAPSPEMHGANVRNHFAWREIDWLSQCEYAFHRGFVGRVWCAYGDWEKIAQHEASKLIAMVDLVVMPWVRPILRPTEPKYRIDGRGGCNSFEACYDEWESQWPTVKFNRPSPYGIQNSGAPITAEWAAGSADIATNIMSLRQLYADLNRGSGA